MSNLATYQIGQTTYVDVFNDIPAGTMVRQGSAAGEGKLLLTCAAGDAMFRGRWQNGNPPDGLLPLTVGGKPSGFGVRLFIEEGGSGVKRSFPHDFTRTFNQGDTVRSDQDMVSYEIYRMNGPVEFGNVDAGPIAQSNVDQFGGGLVVFRSMEIYSLIFRRPACSITPETLTQDVHVGSVHLGDFDNPDRATPWKEFRLTVQECQEPVGMIASFTFGTAADADSSVPDLFSLRGGPANVALEIGDNRKSTIKPGVPARLNALGTGEDFVFNVRMRGTNPSVGGGQFRRPVTVLVNFM
ncbi:fimbrial protein [Luteibacter sp.]|uniref:fimbrial protein n=1 Tax=Luteibacter sp. TaxID=1886636 RepID=UPI002F3EA8F1